MDSQCAFDFGTVNYYGRDRRDDGGIVLVVQGKWRAAANNQRLLRLNRVTVELPWNDKCVFSVM